MKRRDRPWGFPRGRPSAIGRSPARGCFGNSGVRRGNVGAWERESVGWVMGQVTVGVGVSPHFFRQHRLEKNAGLPPTPAATDRGTGLALFGSTLRIDG